MKIDEHKNSAESSDDIPWASRLEKGDRRRFNDVDRLGRQQYGFCCRYMLRVPGLRSDDVRLTAALDVFILWWLDLLLLCTSHTYIHEDCWRAIGCESTREERTDVFLR